MRKPKFCASKPVYPDLSVYDDNDDSEYTPDAKSILAGKLFNNFIECLIGCAKKDKDKAKKLFDEYVSFLPYWVDCGEHLDDATKTARLFVSYHIDHFNEYTEDERKEFKKLIDDVIM